MRSRLAVFLLLVLGACVKQYPPPSYYAASRDFQAGRALNEAILPKDMNGDGAEDAWVVSRGDSGFVLKRRESFSKRGRWAYRTGCRGDLILGQELLSARWLGEDQRNVVLRVRTQDPDRLEDRVFVFDFECSLIDSVSVSLRDTPVQHIAPPYVRGGLWLRADNHFRALDGADYGAYIGENGEKVLLLTELRLRTGILGAPSELTESRQNIWRRRTIGPIPEETPLASKLVKDDLCTEDPTPCESDTLDISREPEFVGTKNLIDGANTVVENATLVFESDAPVYALSFLWRCALPRKTLGSKPAVLALREQEGGYQWILSEPVTRIEIDVSIEALGAGCIRDIVTLTPALRSTL